MFNTQYQQKGNNELVPMTRRYHSHLLAKVLKRDSNIVENLIRAWDEKENKNKDLLPLFLKECKNLSDERYWELLRTVWILSGTVENSDIFRKLMLSNRKEKYCFSTPEEAKKLRELPESFEIYRATNNENDGGIAWTISKEYAEYYKQAFNKEKIITRFIIKKHVFAFIDRNMESEIIALYH
jgi:hypothetical protein